MKRRSYSAAKLRDRREGGVSPYVRHKKTPYRYSENYRKWHAATKRGVYIAEVNQDV